MPSTIDALLVILFAVLPGVPGNTIYKKIAGTNWREEQWITVSRILGISLGGLIIYIIVGNLINAPIPSYIAPATFANFVPNRNILFQMSIAFFGHFTGALIVGFIGGRTTKKLDELTKTSDFVDSWREFVSIHTNGRWVVARIKGGAAYAGYIETADVDVVSSERDVLLAEPAVYIEEQKKYLSLPYNHLFLSGKIIDSIATVSKLSDKRMTTIGKHLFIDTQSEGDKNA